MSDEAAAEEAFLAVEREVGILFRRGRARAGEMSRQVHPSLEGVAYSMLGFIWQCGRVRVTDIGLHFGVGKATISRQIKVIEELGLVVREVDPLDRRSSLVSLTPDGEARFLRARGNRLDRFRRLLGTWETSDVAQFAELLERFNALTAEV
ncbi:MULTISPECIES: MarR family winged helix-turn-helix transcriptional regulator [Kitasatospora]|uniref:DNA-binding MarR family transcriptional regulator n=2 Tax=Kitasatospora TaxID=2063 RepID=A0ABT1IQZ7_9ACTN|nr:MarR family winged helix-turn-helix transcriptional regulator [Kitasatospora paracochleata]MCP2307548.1 DNA-binding MarR family transcriptional regulator [Kitasatospora paracochleata]